MSQKSQEVEGDSYFGTMDLDSGQLNWTFHLISSIETICIYIAESCNFIKLA